jgi:DNA-binding transcriptional ArsR family regulator
VVAVRHAGPAELSSVLEALASPIRREILSRIWDEELPVGDIAAAFSVTAPTISQHLAVLRDAELVTMRVDGNFRRYRARRDRLVGLQRAVFGDSTKWIPADDLPEASLADIHTGRVVVASVELACPPAAAFRGFTDPEIFSRWMGVDVTIENDHLGMTLEWGTVIRGRLVHVVEPSFVTMLWDFDDDNVPVPGGEMFAYTHFVVSDVGCRVEVHQLADTAAHSEFLEVAWGLVLGRAKQGLVDALDPNATTSRRRPRPKTRSRA